MASNPREKLLGLVKLATTPTGNNDEETRSAAVQACALLVQYPHLIVAAPSPAPGLGAPSRRGGTSALHPEAARMRDWRGIMRKKDLLEGVATEASICADCGRPIAKGEAVVRARLDDLTTHNFCSGWWWNYERPTDDD